MKKDQVLEKIKNGDSLIVVKVANFGTSSLTRPITTGLPDKLYYYIGKQSKETQLSSSTGRSVMKMLKKVSSEKTGMAAVTEIYN